MNPPASRGEPCATACPLPALAQRVLGAYGGGERWRRATAVEAVVSVGGLAFRLKGQRGFRKLRVRATVWDPVVRFGPVNSSGGVAVLLGQDVRVEDPYGRLLEYRFRARKYFAGGRRWLWWDRLDLAYFAGCALWTDLSFPALLLRDDVRWVEQPDTALAACFRSHLPTFCPIQVFHFDPSTGLLRQHDFTAEVFGPWAKAAGVVLAHDCSDGVPHPAQRRVMPCGRDGQPRRWPVLAWCQVHEWRLG
jgi:hypothetical protein